HRRCRKMGFALLNPSYKLNITVVPGEGRDPLINRSGADPWVPAFAGMTAIDGAPLMSADDEDPFRQVRLGKLEQLRGLGLDPYPVSFSRTDEAAALDARYQALATGAETNDSVRVAGRIRPMRNSGMFIDLHDASGQTQI